MNKKFISLVVAILMIASIFSLEILAATPSTIISVETDATAVKVGDVVEFKVYVQSSVTLSGIQVFVSTSEGLEYTSGNAVAGLQDTLGADVASFEDGQLFLAAVGGLQNIETKLLVATFSCTVEEGAPEVLTAAMVVGDGAVVDAAYERISAENYSLSDASLNLRDDTTPEYLLGDANHDGKADSSDAVAILRNLAGYEVSNFDEVAADFNGDGKADSSDAVAILRKLAGY